MDEQTAVPPAPTFTAFDAAYTRDQTLEINATYESTWGMPRCLTLLMLSLSSAELLDRFGGTDEREVEALFDAAEQIGAYAKHLRQIAEIADSACARVLTVLQAIADRSSEAAQ